jgi:hypothetical protein
VKKWAIPILTAMLFGVALATHLWGSWLIKFAVANDKAVDSIKKLIELLTILGGLSVAVVKWLFGDSEKHSDLVLSATSSGSPRDVSVTGDNVQTGGISVQGDFSVTGDAVTGNKTVHIQGDSVSGDKKTVHDGDLVEGSKYVIAGDLKILITQQVAAQAIAKQRKTWRDLSHLMIPMIAGLSDSSDGVFIAELFAGLEHTFRSRPYSQFNGMLRYMEKEIHGQTVPVYYLLCHQVEFCEYVRKSTELLLRRYMDTRKQNPTAWEKMKAEQQKLTDAFNKEWNANASFDLSKQWQPLEFTVDSARRLISIRPLPLSLDPSEFPSGITSTSELLRFLASVVNAHGVAYFGNATWYNDNYSLLKLWADLMDHRKIDFERLRINAEDYEEWDYANPALDLEVKNSRK